MLHKCVSWLLLFSFKRHSLFSRTTSVTRLFVQHLANCQRNENLPNSILPKQAQNIAKQTVFKNDQSFFQNFVDVAKFPKSGHTADTILPASSQWEVPTALHNPLRNEQSELIPSDFEASFALKIFFFIFKNGPFPDSFSLFHSFNTVLRQFEENKIADDWIQNADLRSGRGRLDAEVVPSQDVQQKPQD